MGAVPALLLGLIALVSGAELVVRFGSRLARQLGVPPMVIGLTVISLGTSAPELAVAIQSARSDAISLAIGNLAGANLANLLLLLGIIAAFGSFRTDRRTRRLDLPIVVIATLLLWLLVLDGNLRPLDGVILLAVAVAYLVCVVRSTRRSAEMIDAGVEDRPDRPAGGLWRALGQLAAVAVGIAAILVGAEYLVNAAIEVAAAIGISDAVVGLTLVAIGTTLPELATTIVSLVRREPGIGMGNLIGSSIFNITLVLGIALLFVPGAAELDPTLVGRYVPLLVVGTLGCGVFVLSRKQLSQVEGVVLILAYFAYLAFVVLSAG
ncbi:MAG: calcium/sodium antiporter [Propionibacteriaceae bacterium]|nr:calcium/sodium antiporter [Propionibacteriaceae bacterium]